MLLVVKGAAALLDLSFSSILFTIYLPCSSCASISSFCSLFSIRSFSPLYSMSFAIKFLSFSNSAVMFQNSCGLNFFISFSLSQIIFNAADCTLPALSPLRIFLQRSGLILYPTSLSSTLLACCASTSLRSIGLGLFIAVFMAFSVISLKTILHGESISIPSRNARCHDIASPSRSGSVAR